MGARRSREVSDTAEMRRVGKYTYPIMLGTLRDLRSSAWSLLRLIWLDAEHAGVPRTAVWSSRLESLDGSPTHYMIRADWIDDGWIAHERAMKNGPPPCNGEIDRAEAAEAELAALRERLEALVAEWRADARGDDPPRVSFYADDLERSLQEGGEPRPTRWHEALRAMQRRATWGAKRMCFAYVGKDTVCILDLGHDDGAHEPEASE